MTTFNDNFKIAAKTKKIIINLYNLIENIPRKDYFLKEKVNQTSFELLECIFLANELEIKFEYYYINILKSISLLDFLLEILYRKKYISLKQAESQLYLLTEVRKMVNSWRKNKEINDARANDYN
ncbi:MAG: four helix bundle protein [Bacilli bacterium]|nr:four helix bundle protein [Bacilli bacterium]